MVRAELNGLFDLNALGEESAKGFFRCTFPGPFLLSVRSVTGGETF